MLNAFKLLKENPIEVSDVANIGSSTGVEAGSNARVSTFKGTSNINGEVRQIAVNGNRQRLTAVDALLEDRNAGVKECIIVAAFIAIIAVTVTVIVAIAVPVVARATIAVLVIA